MPTPAMSYASPKNYNNQALLQILELQFLIQKPNKLTMTNLQNFKFVFTAEIGELVLKANVSSPTFVTWKRSQQSAISQTIDMTAGKADFKNEVLKLPVNMYFDRDANCFQEKKSSFSFTMKTPKGEKTAGVVYVDLSKMLNNKLTQLNEDFPLEKCPVKDSSVRIKITSQCLGERSGDTQSQASQSAMGASFSSISIPSEPSKIQDNSAKKTSTSAETDKLKDKDKQIRELKQKVADLTKQNQSLKKQLERTKQSVKGDSLKEQFLKSKALQDCLEQQVNTLKKQNLDHEREIEQVRLKLEEAYTNLYSNLSKHFL